jgi:hypothetical protein
MNEWDAHFWPNSNVLKNKAGLTHAKRRHRLGEYYGIDAERMT